MILCLLTLVNLEMATGNFPSGSESPSSSQAPSGGKISPSLLKLVGDIPSLSPSPLPPDYSVPDRVPVPVTMKHSITIRA